MQRSSDCAIAILAAILSVNSCFSIHKVLYNPLGWAWEGASLFMSPFQWHQRRLNPSVKQACERVRLSVPWRAQLSVIHSLSWEKKRWKSTAREQSRCIEIQSRKTQSATYSSGAGTFPFYESCFIFQTKCYCFVFEISNAISNPLHFYWIKY